VRYGPSVRVILYATLRAAVGSRIVELGPEIGPVSTVWDAVHALVARHPVLGSQLLDGDGQLWRQVHVMGNGRDAPYLELGLDTLLSPDDTLEMCSHPLAAGRNTSPQTAAGTYSMSSSRNFAWLTTPFCQPRAV
jgi:molybdopterin converting factor small subunit